MEKVTKDEALSALNSLMELMDGPEDNAWLIANLLNWLVESKNENSTTWLHNIVWAAGDRIDEVLVLIKYIAYTHKTLWQEFPDEAEQITKFADKWLRRKYYF